MSEKNRLDKIIEDCKAKVEERIKMYEELKAIYNPENDKQGSYTWSFMHSITMKLRKTNLHHIKAYQEFYNVKLPKIIIRVLTEVGSGGFINTSLLSFKNELFPPHVLIEKDFLDKCIAAKIDPTQIEYGFNEFYQFENNSFTHPEVQKIYESLNSNRDKYLVIIYGVGHSAVIVLNRENNRRLASADIPGITNLSFTVNGNEYDSPYYQYGQGTVEQVICPLNTSWWNKMKQDIINQNA